MEPPTLSDSIAIEAIPLRELHLGPLAHHRSVLTASEGFRKYVDYFERGCQEWPFRDPVLVLPGIQEDGEVHYYVTSHTTAVMAAKIASNKVSNAPERIHRNWMVKCLKYKAVPMLDVVTQFGKMVWRDSQMRMRSPYESIVDRYHQLVMLQRAHQRHEMDLMDSTELMVTEYNQDTNSQLEKSALFYASKLTASGGSGAAVSVDKSE